MSVNDDVQRAARSTTRGSRGGSGPDRSDETYTGRGHTSVVQRMPAKKPPRHIPGVTLSDGTCMWCSHKSARTCESRKCQCTACSLGVREPWTPGSAPSRPQDGPGSPHPGRAA